LIAQATGFPHVSSLQCGRKCRATRVHLLHALVSATPSEFEKIGSSNELRGVFRGDDSATDCNIGRYARDRGQQVRLQLRIEHTARALREEHQSNIAVIDLYTKPLHVTTLAR
jgi:hypothetical protein